MAKVKKFRCVICNRLVRQEANMSGASGCPDDTCLACATGIVNDLYELDDLGLDHPRNPPDHDPDYDPTGYVPQI